MNFSTPDSAIGKFDLGGAFQFSPPASAVGLLQIIQVADIFSYGDYFSGLNFPNDLEFHADSFAGIPGIVYFQWSSAKGRATNLLCLTTRSPSARNRSATSRTIGLSFTLWLRNMSYLKSSGMLHLLCWIEKAGPDTDGTARSINALRGLLNRFTSLSHGLLINSVLGTGDPRSGQGHCLL